ncbi:MAG: hypothetical protein ABJL99_26695 [Aliishimia sp.]
MSYLGQPANVHLFASGILPYPSFQRVFTHAASHCLQAWRTLGGLQSKDEIYENGFVNDRGDMSLHADGLRDDWQTVRNFDQNLTLVYLHRGQQSDAQSPVLQHLLHAIDHTGPVYALRVESRRALKDALDLAKSLATQSGLVVVLSDPTDRLVTQPSRRRSLRFLVLGNRSTAQKKTAWPALRTRRPMLKAQQKEHA